MGMSPALMFQCVCVCQREPETNACMYIYDCKLCRPTAVSDQVLSLVCSPYSQALGEMLLCG
jgi:hypothetical protein